MQDPSLRTYRIAFLGSNASGNLPMFTRVQKAQDRMISVVRENAQGVRVIKALSKADHEKRRYEKVNTELVEEELRANSRMAPSTR